MSNLFSIEFRGSESNAVERYMSFFVRAAHCGFAGEVEFVIPENELQHFIDQLNEFYRSYAGAPVLVAGKESLHAIEIRLSQYSFQGIVGLSCSMCSSDVHGPAHKVELFAGIEVYQVMLLAKFLEGVVRNGLPDTWDVRIRW